MPTAQAAISITQAWLGHGDVALDDAIDFFADDPLTWACFLNAGSLHIGPPTDAQNGDPNRRTRELAFDVFVRGVNGAHLATLRQRVERKLQEAKRVMGNAGGTWVGEPVVFRLLEKGGLWSFFDVQDGSIEEDAKNRDQGPDTATIWTVKLLCAEDIRGASFTVTAAALVAGPAASFLVPFIPGDRPALVEASYADSSTVDVVQRIHTAVRSHHALRELADYQPFKVPTAASGSSTGTDAALAGTGAYVRRTATGTPTPVAEAVFGGDVFSHGPFDLVAYVRDGGALIGTTRDLVASVQLGGGSVVGYIGLAVTGVTAGGVEGRPAFVNASAYTASAIKLTWTVDATASYYRIYLLGGEGSPGTFFDHISPTIVGSVATYTIATTAGGAPGVPPSSGGASTALPTLWQAQITLDVPTPAFWIPGVRIAETALGGGQWERLYLGQFEPPSFYELGSPLPYRIRILGWSQGGTASTLDVALVATLPADEPQQVAEYPGLALTTRSTWKTDTRRDRKVQAYLSDGANPTGFATVRGRFELNPGAAVVCVELEGTGGVWQGGLGVTPTLRITPRYADVRGLL